jgi:predicted DNA binding protein
MRYIESWVRVRHPCPFCEYSDRFPEAEMTLWVSALSDLFQVTYPGDYHVDEMLEVGKEMLAYSEAYHDSNSILFLTQQPYLEQIDSVMAVADETDCMLVPPMTFHQGWETHRLVTRTQDNVRRFVNEVAKKGEVEVLSLKSLDHMDLMNDVGVVPGLLLEGLTDKQAYVLTCAYEAGLFDVPARIKMDKVADKVGLSRSTFGEHLRKAEYEVLRNLYPFLRLRCCREGDPFCASVKPVGK